ncbi:uncharacterized protein YbbC (DUF1343 family) [Actinoplanes lutulentus]|uniref:Uncharacterized protein YbbC (DUF1343 family) n=1 Tax=Actinoplanes lutulentus TaxID=1287878 RepID=A0A327ZNW7_9ACTN|nr:DUF1343 domain-containing protein [Actinoplanes lutulentus]MBB2940743.1 uncharacterized protein YbbC (DUF1343 family) [Actinoplanes lutulentus]RAK43054.1 uncharacterized protein YbbC (DUF1343 family) [Actinoplanes lutulentus]
MRRRTLISAAGVAGAFSAVSFARPAVAQRSAVRTGLDRLAAEDWARLRGGTVGVVSNLTAVDREYRHLVDRMHAAGVKIGGIFGPEHGFRGSTRVGGDSGTDARTGLKVYDAYRVTHDQWAALFTEAGVRTVVFDIQDVGARFYTYIWTLYDSMVAAARLGLRYVVLDRPNPIGGRAFGPMLKPAFTSGVGLKEIVQQHGMTVGELARFYNGEFLTKPARLEVVACEGWHGGLFAADTDVPWVMPSPNMPTPDTAAVYPGTCLFEGVSSISEGRGTTRPFEISGSPSLDYRWRDTVASHNLPGVALREAYFVPVTSKFTEQLCGGIELKVTKPSAFDPIRTAVAMLVEARKLPGFAWRDDNPGRPPFADLLFGSDGPRKMIDAGASVPDIVASWQDDLTAFNQRRKPYLLYPRGH